MSDNAWEDLYLDHPDAWNQLDFLREAGETVIIHETDGAHG